MKKDKYPYWLFAIGIFMILGGVSFTEDTWILPAKTNDWVGIPLISVGSILFFYSLARANARTKRR